MWKYCRLSNKKLQLPIMSDYKGHLFNKEAILEWLLTPGREDYTDAQIAEFSHIKRLDDVVELHGVEERADTLKCQYGDIALGETNAKLVYVVPCGDVLPRQALSGGRCPQCGASYRESDIITINPTSAKTTKSLQDRMATLHQEMRHHNGKLRKPKRNRMDQTQPTKIRKL
ncbi:hypothetical protein HG537_0G00370 [Torulaspora globosa]|uniref:Replication termination factor 2 n=1 Tax=Torulaspora globosa TaxID=48254 RepID=A0A7H9HWV2_9SACH|nr:hypothetical protein HG537_0G00370 [Torulaspora sp. CBS 2947]